MLVAKLDEASAGAGQRAIELAVELGAGCVGEAEARHKRCSVYDRSGAFDERPQRLPVFDNTIINMHQPYTLGPRRGVTWVPTKYCTAERTANGRT